MRFKNRGKALRDKLSSKIFNFRNSKGWLSFKNITKFSLLWGFILNYIVWSLLGWEFTIFTLIGYGFLWWMLYNELATLYRKFRL